MWESYVSSEETRTGGISYQVYVGNRGWNVKEALVREPLFFCLLTSPFPLPPHLC